MATLRLRLSSSETEARQLGSQLADIDGVERVEHLSNLMPQMDDPDSSSAGLVADRGPASQVLEVEYSDPNCAPSIHKAAERFAIRHGAALEAEREEMRGLDEKSSRH